MNGRGKIENDSFVLSNMLRVSYYTHGAMSFPEDFLFGVSTASYQIEGGWNADCKGENIWDRLVHTKPELVRNKENGDVACDSYNLFKEDIACIKEIGFTVYRFSISWSRILPKGEITYINDAGVKYYHTLIDQLLSNGIQPMVTMYHWDLPQQLQDMGGWLNPLMIDYTEDYASLLFQLYGEKVKFWITINEPASIISGYCEKGKRCAAPALHLDSPANYIVAYNLLRAHARVYRLYDQKFRTTQKGKVGITIDTNCYKEKTSAEEDIQAARRAWAFYFEIFANPIYSDGGDFPEIVKNIVAENSKQEGRRRSRLPKFTDEEIDLIKGSSDFFGLNNYTTWLCTPEKPPYLTLASEDVGVELVADPNWPRFHGVWNVVPWGLREILQFVKDKYNNPPVFITENGYCTESRELDDIDRINYFREYLREVLKARDDFGCNVIGYSVWSIMDNFEWNDGYLYRFGIFDVDFTDPGRKRTPRSSTKFFKQLLETRNIPE